MKIVNFKIMQDRYTLHKLWYNLMHKTLYKYISRACLSELIKQEMIKR